MMNRTSSKARSRKKKYNYAFLDEGTKREVRRAILKAIAIPGYQVPFGSRDMPLPYGWGTGGIQVTASLVTPSDVLKVIDQGADDTTNAVNIRRFFEKTADVQSTEDTVKADIIQTRHRIPEEILTDDQIIVYQVPQPEPMRALEPREVECRKIHALEEYGLMHVRLYENIAQYGRIAINYGYPVLVNNRYIMSPTPIPRFVGVSLDSFPSGYFLILGKNKPIPRKKKGQSKTPSGEFLLIPLLFYS